MKRYLFFVLLVLVVEIGILVGISLIFDTNLLTTFFYGSCFFTFFAFLIGTTGDALSKNSQVAVFDSLLGSYKPQHEKMTFSISPFLIGSLLCLGTYFSLYYLGVIG
ncbi:hypothetical protein ABN702_19255 [Bacillus haimaensis]|uniref:hypothetical protein n=1 Tax=Bacillus haimaensis TaxID=3160967 RepID=UPI003AA984A1